MLFVYYIKIMCMVVKTKVLIASCPCILRGKKKLGERNKWTDENYKMKCNKVMNMKMTNRTGSLETRCMNLKEGSSVCHLENEDHDDKHPLCVTILRRIV